MYRLRKFARRNRGLVTGVVTVAALLVAGITATTWQAVRARRAEADAHRNAQVAESVNAFLTGMLEQANPHTNPFGREMTVGEMLDEAARRLGPELEGPSDLRAALEQTVGQAYAALDRVEDAQVHLDEAVALRRQGDDPERLRSALRELGLLAERRADPEGAHALALEEVELATNAFGARSVPAARSLLRLARTHALRNEFAVADSLFDRGWSILATVEPEATDVAALRDHASLLLDLGRVDQAEVEARRVLAHFETRLGPDHADTASAMSLLARILSAQGALEEGIALQRRALSTSERILGTDSREVILARSALGESLTNTGHADEALAILRVAEASALRLFGERATLRAELLRRIGAAQLTIDDVTAAESSFREALSILREKQGDAPSLCYPMNDHAAALRRLGRYAEAEPLFVEAQDRAKQIYGDEHTFLAVMLSNLATTRANLGRYDEALASFAQAVAMADATYPPDRPEPDRIRSRYGECLLQAGRAADAAPVLTRARDALRIKVGDEHPWTRDTERWLAQALAED
jgi:tetratricopeptide (TPR) repeat protein